MIRQMFLFFCVAVMDRSRDHMVLSSVRIVPLLHDSNQQPHALPLCPFRPPATETAIHALCKLPRLIHRFEYIDFSRHAVLHKINLVARVTGQSQRQIPVREEFIQCCLFPIM